MGRSPERPLTLASYNIRAGLGTDLKRDPARVLHAINALDADIVALQEADHRTGLRPAALPHAMILKATGLCPLPVADNPESLGWHGVALLAHPDIQVAQIRRFDLPGLEPRGAVIVDVTPPDAGPIRIVGVRLGLLHRSRRAQLRRIRHELDRLPPLPTVILGDFNEWSARRELGTHLGPDYTVLTPGRTFPSRLPVLPLDRIAHCPRLDVRILPTARATHPHASDHLPVLAHVAPADGSWRAQKDSNPQPAD